jgi:hypothetical protein
MKIMANNELGLHHREEIANIFVADDSKTKFDPALKYELPPSIEKQVSEFGDDAEPSINSTLQGTGKCTRLNVSQF